MHALTTTNGLPTGHSLTAVIQYHITRVGNVRTYINGPASSFSKNRSTRRVGNELRNKRALFALLAAPTDCVEACLQVGVSEMSMTEKGVRTRRACDLHTIESRGGKVFAARCVLLGGNMRSST